MEVKDWLSGLPDELRWSEVTWVNQPTRQPALLATTDSQVSRFEPADVAWYEELKASLDRNKRTVPLFRAALPIVESSSRAAALQVAEDCAAASGESTDEVFSTSGRLVCAVAPEQKPIDDDLLGAACVSVALQFRYDFSPQRTWTLVSKTVDEVETRIEFGDVTQKVFDSVGRANAARISTVEKHTDLTLLPLKEPKTTTRRNP